MSRLNELIQSICPNGIEYKNLKDVLSIERGKRVVKKQLSEVHGYPVYQNSLTPLGLYVEYNCPENTAFVIMAGAAGEIGYSRERFWAADDCFAIVCPSSICSKYIYHVLLNEQWCSKEMSEKPVFPDFPETH